MNFSLSLAFLHLVWTLHSLGLWSSVCLCNKVPFRVPKTRSGLSLYIQAWQWYLEMAKTGHDNLSSRPNLCGHHFGFNQKVFNGRKPCRILMKFCTDDLQLKPLESYQTDFYFKIIHPFTAYCIKFGSEVAKHEQMSHLGQSFWSIDVQFVVNILYITIPMTKWHEDVSMATMPW